MCLRKCPVLKNLHSLALLGYKEEGRKPYSYAVGLVRAATELPSFNCSA